MTPAAIARLGFELSDARVSRSAIDQLNPMPADEREAYAIQDAIIANSDSELAGWKIGATSAFAQDFLDCEGPFAGPIFCDGVYLSGDVLPEEALLHPMVEPEFAFTMKYDLDPIGEQHTVEQVRNAIRGVHLAIEIVGGCFPDISDCGVLALIADRGANVAIVLSDEIRDWSPVAIAESRVRLLLDDQEVGAGVGTDALGNPLNALTWLANDLSKRGRTLAAGQVVTTGTCGGAARLALGSTCRAEFSNFGAIEFSYA